MFLGVCVLAEAAEKDEAVNSLAAPVHYIDRMDPVRGYKTESLFGSFESPPSRILATRGPWGHEDLDAAGYGKNGLKIVCELQPAPENPTAEPGWAAYYTTLKKGDVYFNAQRFNYLTFWIRGEEGGEKIQASLLDHQSKEGAKRIDSGTIEAYTQRGVIDKDWQKVRIPLDIFQVDLRELYQVILIMDNKLYDTIKARTVTVYVDDLAFE